MTLEVIWFWSLPWLAFLFLFRLGPSLVDSSVALLSTGAGVSWDPIANALTLSSGIDIDCQRSLDGCYLSEHKQDIAFGIQRATASCCVGHDAENTGSSETEQMLTVRLKVTESGKGRGGGSSVTGSVPPPIRERACRVDGPAVFCRDDANAASVDPLSDSSAAETESLLPDVHDYFGEDFTSTDLEEDAGFPLEKYTLLQPFYAYPAPTLAQWWEGMMWWTFFTAVASFVLVAEMASEGVLDLHE